MKRASDNPTRCDAVHRTRRDDLVFRVFVSSTFQDFQEEREALQKFVWPLLEKDCRMREALFQAIDLRWGVSSEASLDQQTMNICAAELCRCQQLSPRPNFVILLGNRYGWCPLPAQIPADEFDELLAHVPDDDDLEFLLWNNPPSSPPTGMGWYALDRNAILRPLERPGNSGEYVLRRRRPGTSEEKRETWDAIEKRLRGIFSDAMCRARWTEDDPRRRKHVLSATHQEIELGAFRVADPQQHVFAYLRDIPDPPHAAVAGGFADEDQTRVNALRESVCDLIPSNTRRYSIRWGSGSLLQEFKGRDALISEGAETHMSWNTACSAFIARLCSDVYSDLKGVIEREIAAYEALPESKRESSIHDLHGRDAGRLLIGRDSELAAISDYIDSASPCPFLVFGPHGMGKTALLAGAWISHSTLAKSVFRSIGTTPRSTDLHHLLRDISLELCPGIEISPEDDACIGFMSALAHAEKSRKMIIWLDGLDRLTSQHEAHLFAWFPSLLPSQVKLIVSANPEGRQVRAGLSVLRNRMPSEQIMELQPLSPLVGLEILDSWLEQEGRTLQPLQSEAVLQAFAGSRRPLMLRLAFHVARGFHSWDDAVLDGRGLGSFNSLSDLLAGILNRAGQGHGDALVSRAFGCISVSREGLAENELLAILSRDSRFLSEALSLYPESPSIRKLPPIIWYRLFRDVEFLFGMRQVDAIRTLSFTHEIIANVVLKDVLAHGDEERTCRLTLADYFETEAAGIRQADELTFQLDALEEWERLKNVLLNVPLAESVWRRHGPELVHFWVKITKKHDIHLAEAYDARWRHALSQGMIPTSVAVVLGNLGYPEAAETILDAVIEDLRRRGEPSEELGSALCGKANFLMARHDRLGARPLLQEALRIYQGLSRRRAFAQCLSDLAGTLFQDAPKEALRLLSQAEAAWRETRSPEGLAACLGNQANIEMGRGNTGEALRLQREALRICRDFRFPIPTAEHQSSLGMLLAHAGEIKEALDNLQAADATYRDFGLPGPRGACLGQMANLHARQGDLRRAFEINEEALALLRNSGQHVWLATCLLNQAGLSLELGEYAVGRQRAEEALEKLRLCSAPAALQQRCLALLMELRRRP